MAGERGPENAGRRTRRDSHDFLREGTENAENADSHDFLREWPETADSHDFLREWPENAEEHADSHDFLGRRTRTSGERARRTRTAMTSFGKVINVHRDDYAITAIAVRFAGSIKELETI